MQKSIQNDSKGFTIIEALLAMLILSIGLLGTAQLLYSVMESNAYAGNITAATTLAQDKLEILKNTGYAGIASDPTPEYNIDAEGNTGGVYTRTTTVDDATLTNMKIIDVTVTWNWKGASKSTTLKYIIKQPS